jgi:hypothetical protein
LRPVVVPAFVSGAIWACAQIGWFVASDNLSMVVSFPIITTLPAIIGMTNPVQFVGLTVHWAKLCVGLTV